MKILVTGATGFIGQYVVQYLINLKKHEIIATSIDDIESISFPWINEVKYIKCNLNEEKDNSYKFFQEPDLLIHLAWEGLPNFKELYHFERNAMLNYVFLKNIIKNGLKELAVTGTCFEYGWKEGSLHENLEANPNTAYALGKDTLRRFIEQLQNVYKFNFRWIRLFYMYGKGQTPKSIIPQLDKALDNNEEVFNMSGGEQLRDYLPVEKVAEFIIKISLQNKVNGIINCCSGKPISIKELVENHMRSRNKTIKLKLGYYDYPDYVPMAFWGDDTKLKKILKEYDD